MKPELVAPAGSLEKLKFALAFGADAVYAGVPRFSLRARENEFNDEILADAVQYTQKMGKKIYLTLNIFPHNRKLQPFEDALKRMNELKPDALILSDPGVVAMSKELCPDIEIHLSTQANTVNWRSVKFWSDLGVKRIILSRELSLDEISEIRSKNPEMELEAFVHGAICVAYSGRCLLSNYFNHRDPNQGTCTNSCRWQYHMYKEGEEYQPIDGQYYIEENDRQGNLLPIDEDEFGTYIMNSKDMCAIGILDQMAAAGVDGFKIEGRTKSVYYLSVITRAYRIAIENLKTGKKLPPEIEQEVLAVANREYITGFLEKNPGQNGINFVQSHSDNQTHLFCGIVEGLNNGAGTARIRVRNRFEIGDEMELITPDDTISFKLNEMHTTKGELITVAHGGGQDVDIVVPEKTGEYSLLRKKLT